MNGFALALVGTVGVLVVPVLLVLRGVRRATALPATRPSRFLARGRRAERVVVCAGDSITHGAVSADWVARLARELGPGVDVINAGINSHLSWNLLQRLDEILACRPDDVVVLIGTNDVNATLSPAAQARYRKDMKLPREASLAWYAENLDAIARRLRETGARVVLVSPPLIGEDPDSEANRRTAEAARIVADVASRHGCAFVDLRAAQLASLTARGRPPAPPYDVDDLGFMFGAIAAHELLGHDWDRVADDRGLWLLTDHLHLSERGATQLLALLRGPLMAR